MGSSKARQWSIIGGTIAALLALSACSGDGGSADGNVKLRLGTMQLSSTHLPQIAIDQGFFAEKGVEVELTFANSGAELLPALQAGAIDIAYSNVVSPLLAAGQGFKFSMILDNGQFPSAPPDNNPVMVRADSGIESLADLQGKRVAVVNVGGLNDVFLIERMREQGLDPSGISWVEAPFPTMVDGLLSDQYDAAVTAEPVTTLANNSGKIKELDSFFSRVNPGFNLAGYYVMGDWVAKPENAEAITAFNAAMEQARKYVVDGDKADEVRYVTEWSSLDQGLVEAIVDNDLTLRSGYIDLPSLQRTADLLHKQGLLNEPLDVTAHVWSGAPTEQPS
ncbi:ABC transporter substrate-binding protein [Micromonospora radicis]|uniref:ABC transporter substrate-binding protein n=1 Tax=Micromonospora radicis TaxID=1894971 RepID=A0A418MY14_9ACTN|nr:ABC transporter substrate-binding protein [Micromonospora radicis]RIV40023.1 ABC transporter substrate-binding protein [Micromonospora radicis]